MSLLALKTARFIYWIGYNRRPSTFCEDADVVFKSMILFIVGSWLHVHHDHEDRVRFVFLISQQTWLVWLACADNAYQLSGGDNNSRGASNPRNTGEREGEREGMPTNRDTSQKQNILMEIKHWKPQQRNKTRSSGAFFIDTQNCLCVILHHLKIPVKYLLLAINTFECGWRVQTLGDNGSSS